MAEYFIALDKYDKELVHFYSTILGNQHQYVTTIHIDFVDAMIPYIAALLEDEGECMIELSGEIIKDDDIDAGYDPRTEALTIGERNLGLAQEYRR